MNSKPMPERWMVATGAGPRESHKYVNGVLDKLARQQRSVEINAGA